MKRALIAFLTFGVVLAAVAGFAASLNLTAPSSLGAGSATVSSCDDVSVAWGDPTYSGSDYKILTVTVTEDTTDDVQCNGKAVSVTVGGKEATGTINASGTTTAMTIPTGGVNAEDVVNVAVVVS